VSQQGGSDLVANGRLGWGTAHAVCEPAAHSLHWPWPQRARSLSVLAPRHLRQGSHDIFQLPAAEAMAADAQRALADSRKAVSEARESRGLFFPGGKASAWQY